MKPFRDWTQADVEAHNSKTAKRDLQPEAAKSDQKEVGNGGIQDEIEQWLKSQSHRAWWSRSRTDKATTNRIGTPDFVIFFQGVCVGIEVKRAGRKPTTEQLGELAWMRKAGAKTLIAYSLEDVKKFFLEF